MIKQYVFRCDADEKNGLGHLIRSINLARVLIKNNNKIKCLFYGDYNVFAKNLLTKYSIPFVTNNKNVLKNSYLIIDNYYVTQDEIKEFKRIVKKLIKIDDFNDLNLIDFDLVVNLNLKAAYFLAQSAAKSMKGRGGSIIQISSQMAHVGGPDRAVYCATKHGVEGFNKAMAIELGPENIRVNSISPTFILTPMTEKTFSDPVKRLWINDKIKLPRVGMVEDIMGAVIYLASDASSLVTGTTILVDGGWTAD